MPDVGVIIPAYNAGRTLDATLSSVRRQTYPHLQIVVCDDGSTDDTADIARRHAADDRRVTLVRQPNAGVAAARNRAAAETDAPFLAPIDADDVWHPLKIERQVEVLRADDALGLVYVWSAQLDPDNCVLGFDPPSSTRGHVADALCRHNFTGNGSTVLIRRDVFEEIGGYDPSLRAAKAEGCEDWDLAVKIALVRPFGVVEDYLCGYRIAPGSMSSHVRQMWRSFRMICRRTAVARPDLADALDAGSYDIATWLAAKSLLYKQYGAFFKLLSDVGRERPGDVVKLLGLLPVAVARGMLSAGVRARLRRLRGREAAPGGNVIVGRPFVETTSAEREAVLGRSS